MMEVLRHSVVSAGGSLGRLPAHTNNDGGGGPGGGGDAVSTLSDPTNMILRSPTDSGGGGGGGGTAAGFYSEPDDLKSDDASSLTSGFTSADSIAPTDPKSPSKDRFAAFSL